MTRGTLHPNAAVMSLDKHPTQVETESQAQIQFMLDCMPLGAIEAFPEMLTLFWRDAWPLVMDRDTDERFFLGDVHTDWSFRGGIGERIAQIGLKDLRDPAGIGTDGRRRAAGMLSSMVRADIAWRCLATTSRVKADKSHGCMDNGSVLV